MKYTKKFNYIKKIVFYIYDFECQCCGVETFNLDLHHVDKNILNNDLFNLKPVCKYCHKMIHKNVEMKFDFLMPKQKILLFNLNQKLKKF